MHIVVYIKTTTCISNITNNENSYSINHCMNNIWKVNSVGILLQPFLPEIPF